MYASAPPRGTNVAKCLSTVVLWASCSLGFAARGGHWLHGSFFLAQHSAPFIG